MRRLTVAVATGFVVLAVPSAAFADAAAPSDFKSEIVSITPATEAVTASIEGGDSFIRIVVAPGHDVQVEGYAGEPYLWIDAEGVVHENQHSPATYYNRNRNGVATLPPKADPEAEPNWKVVGHDGVWAWHDHRAHWMGGAPPADMKAGESLPVDVGPAHRRRGGGRDLRADYARGGAFPVAGDRGWRDRTAARRIRS